MCLQLANSRRQTLWNPGRLADSAIWVRAVRGKPVRCFRVLWFRPARVRWFLRQDRISPLLLFSTCRLCDFADGGDNVPRRDPTGVDQLIGLAGVWHTIHGEKP